MNLKPSRNSGLGQTLKIKVLGKSVEVDRKEYVLAKTDILKRFGYSRITTSEVDDQISLILKGKDLSSGLSIIGAFLKDEIVL